MKGKFLGFFLLGYWLIGCNTTTNSFEKSEVKERSQVLIKYVANHYPKQNNSRKPSGFDGGLSDFGKYNYPKILAVFQEYGDTVKLWNNQLDVYSQKPTFHFNLLGLTRLLYQFPESPGIKKNEKEFLKRVFERTDSYNPWTAEGTENHVNMSRCSGYLYAQLALEKYPQEFPDAGNKLKLMKEWVNHYAHKVKEMGTGEWNSSIYGSYNILPWINLYDFCSDAEVKSMAKIVLDYYAIELAHNYFQGLIGGADMRGKGNYKSFQGSGSYLGWLWFGDSPSHLTMDNLNQNLKGSTHIAQNIHAALSEYRPPKQAYEIRNMSGMYYHSKPDYLLSKAGYIKHTHYKTETFHLGAGYFPYGGWSAGDFQIVPWKLLSRVDQGPFKSVQYLSGIGGQTPNKQYSNGNMRSPYDQHVQHKQILVQMTRIPEHVHIIQDSMKVYFKEWYQNWRKDFAIRFPNDMYKQNEKPVKYQALDLSANSSHLIFHPNNGDWKQHYIGKNILLEMEQNWVFIQSIRGDSVKQFTKKKTSLITTAVYSDYNHLCGFIIEVLSKKNYTNIEEVKILLDKTKLNSVTGLANNFSYISTSSDTLNITYNTSGEFTEPIFDWGYNYIKPTHIHKSPPISQPEWPSGEGHGKIATWTINGDTINLHEKWDVYDLINTY